MTFTSITLTDPVSGLSVPVWPADGVAAQVLDVAAPARAVSEDRVNASGSYDVTRYAAAAAVSLSLLLYPGVTQTPEKFWDAIAPLLNPSLRCNLVAVNDQWAQAGRQLTVRFDSTAKPFSDVTNWPVQISWSAPAGVWEDASVTVGAVAAFIAATTGWTSNPATDTGFAYTATSATPAVFTATGNDFANGVQVVLSGGTPPSGALSSGEPAWQNGKPYFVVGLSGSTFKLDTSPGGTGLASTSTGSGTVTDLGGVSIPVGGVVMPASTAPSPSIVTSAGASPSQWTAALYGPCTGPKLANDTTGLTLEFTDDLVLAPGEFAQLDSATRTVTRNNDPGQVITGNLNFRTSDWWLVQPGTNLLRYYPSSAGAGSVALVSFRAAWPA